MAAIAPVPNTTMSQYAPIKNEPVVQTTEVPLLEAEQEPAPVEDIKVEGESSQSEAEAEGENAPVQAYSTGFEAQKHGKKPPHKKPRDPVVKPQPYPDKPTIGLPYVPPKDVVIKPFPMPGPEHPVFVPNSTIIQNVETHVLCNDWFVQNVRELVEEYKRMRSDNTRQAVEIAGLNRVIEDLRMKLKIVEAERDDWRLDYENESYAHEETRAILLGVQRELSELRIRYGKTLADLKKTKASLNESLLEIARLKVEIANKTDRIRDLEEKLRISNASEDAANEKVIELQKSIYELELSNSRIERLKDSAELIARERVDQARILELEVVGLRDEIWKLKKHLAIHKRKCGFVGIYEELEVSISANADEAVQAVEEAPAVKEEEKTEPVEAQAESTESKIEPAEAEAEVATGGTEQSSPASEE